MFKATDNRTNQPIVILDHFSDDEMLSLRNAVRDGQIRCPVCGGDLTVRAGEIRVRHFAHRHLENCPSSHEPPELLQARAALYRWLKVKTDAVTIEKHLDGIPLPRHIDCWLETPEMKFAFWIAHNRMKPLDRQMVQDAAAKTGAKLIVILLTKMMKRHKNCPTDVLHLSTTERRFIAIGQLDFIYKANASREGSLYYLDVDTENLHTLRALHCMEYPNYYVGTEIVTPLADVKISSTLTLPGEYDRLQIFLAESRKAAALKMPAPEPRTESAQLWSKEKLSPQSPTFSKPTITSGFSKWEATCIFCGVTTRDWYKSSGGSKNCICFNCQDRDGEEELT